MTEPEPKLIYKTNIEKLTNDERNLMCFRLIQEGRLEIKNTTQSYMKFGQILDHLLAKGLWKHYRQGIASRSEFVKEAFNISVSMCEHIRRISRTFRDVIGDRTIPFYRLLEAKTIVNDSNVAEVLDKAENLSHTDWETEIKVWKGKPDRDLCAHLEVELWQRCKNPLCGKWLRKV